MTTTTVRLLVAEDDGRILAVLEGQNEARGESPGAQELEVNVTDAELAGAKSGHFAFIRGSGFVELPFRAMLLGAGDILEEVVELKSSAELTERHVDLRPLGGDCDRAPGAYRWNRERQALEPLKSAAQRPRGGVDLETALADFFRGCSDSGVKLPASTAAWLKQQEKVLGQ